VRNQRDSKIDVREMIRPKRRRVTTSGAVDRIFGRKDGSNSNGLLEQMPRSRDRRASARMAPIAPGPLRSTPILTRCSHFERAKSKPYRFVLFGSEEDRTVALPLKDGQPMRPAFRRRRTVVVRGSSAVHQESDFCHHRLRQGILEACKSAVVRTPDQLY